MKHFSMLIMVILISQASVTRAESPWVLWLKNDKLVEYTSGRKKESSSWKIVDAYQNLTQCKTKAVENATEGASSWNKKDSSAQMDHNNAGALYVFIY